MITIKENTLERIKSWTKDSIYILTDFDHTLTSNSSTTSWGILEKSNYIPKEYNKKRMELFNYYGPKEFDETIKPEEKQKLMDEWWNKHLNLFIEYQLSEEIVTKESSKKDTMILRDGTKTLLQNLHQNNIPVIIISAGIGNFIEAFLKNNNCYYDNIHIISNFISFKNGIADGITSKLINSQNKNEITLSSETKNLIGNRTHPIIIGDNTGDAEMSQVPDALRIGFLEKKVTENKVFYEETFDIVCTNSSFQELINILPILQNK